MKNILLLLFIVFSFSIYSQSFQRMRIATGSYNLNSFENSLPSQCLDQHLPKPSTDDYYEEISDNITIQRKDSNGKIEQLLLKEAINKWVKIHGNYSTAELIVEFLKPFENDEFTVNVEKKSGVFGEKESDIRNNLPNEILIEKVEIADSEIRTFVKNNFEIIFKKILNDYQKNTNEILDDLDKSILKAYFKNNLDDFSNNLQIFIWLDQSKMYSKLFMKEFVSKIEEKGKLCKKINENKNTSEDEIYQCYENLKKYDDFDNIIPKKTDFKKSTVKKIKVEKGKDLKEFTSEIEAQIYIKEKTKECRIEEMCITPSKSKGSMQICCNDACLTISSEGDSEFELELAGGQISLEFEDGTVSLGIKLFD